MAEFSNGQVKDLRDGEYMLVYQSVGGSGTGQIEISKDDGTSYQVMTDGTFTTSEDRYVILANGKYRFTLTGDARLWLEETHTGK